jgi:hypothetical protein
MNLSLVLYRQLVMPEFSGVDSRSEFDKYFKTLRTRMSVRVFCANYPINNLNSHLPACSVFE